MPYPKTPCEYAIERHQNLLRWRNLWTILLFVFGTAVIIFLVIAIFFYLREAFLPGAISTLGTIVSGVSVKWVLDRRNDAKAEEEAGYQDVKTVCTAPVPVEDTGIGIMLSNNPPENGLTLAKAADRNREKYKLVGNIY